LLLLRMWSDHGEQEKALAHAWKWHREKPENRSIQGTLGVVLLRSGDAETATPHLLATRDGFPLEFVEKSLGIIARQHGEWEQAATHFQQELAHFPDDTLQQVLGDVFVHLSEWDAAVHEYCPIQKRSPDNVTVGLKCAQATFNTGDHATTATIISQLLANVHDHPDVLLLHANNLSKQGKKDAAKAIFKRASLLHQARKQAR